MTTPAEIAVDHILNRVVNDRDFSWHMMGTQSLRLCIKAEAAARNRTEDEVERTLHRQMEEAQPRLERNGAGKAQLPAIREQLESVTEAIDDLYKRGDIDKAAGAKLYKAAGRTPPKTHGERSKTTAIPAWL